MATLSEKKQKQASRPPVVVVMGHVDHGKTSLLDCIRNTKITAREAGGITQHLGAYEVEQNNRRITFLDTPGHEAFAAIRQRGSKVADIALLIIAADEGLKPQTVEVISYIKKEKLPFIVVLNKIDRPGSNPEKVKQALAEQEVYVEEWGGNVPCVSTCATTGQGIEALLEMILLVADMEELTADPEAPFTGIILESTIDMRRGITATILITQGSLRTGDTVYAPNAKVKVRFLEDFLGKRIDAAGVSSPCIVTGWDKQPVVGDPCSSNESEQPQTGNKTKDSGAQPAQDGDPKQTSRTFVLKADMSGSLEALLLMCEQLFNELKLPYEIVGQSTGDIVLADLKLAENTNAAIIAFNSKLTAEAKGYYKPEKISLFEGNIIYHLIESIKKHLQDDYSMNQEVILGKMNVIAVFSSPDKKNHQIIGGSLQEGTLKLPMRCNIIRGDQKIGNGKLLSIKKNKQEIDSCTAPGEFGVQIELKDKGIAIAVGDNIEFKK